MIGNKITQRKEPTTKEISQIEKRDKRAAAIDVPEVVSIESCQGLDFDVKVAQAIDDNLSAISQDPPQ